VIRLLRASLHAFRPPTPESALEQMRANGCPDALRVLLVGGPEHGCRYVISEPVLSMGGQRGEHYWRTDRTDESGAVIYEWVAPSGSLSGCGT
jgi:hypothetical protein